MPSEQSVSSEQPVRTAVVTGASSGIGAASARALAGEGFRVVCAARRLDRLEELVAEIGGVAVQCDVTDAASVARLAEVAPVVDVLVNNAGVALDAARVEDAQADHWQRMFDVNVAGTLRVTQALLPSLRAAGRSLIINMGSTAGTGVYEGGAGYVAAKHGVHALTQTMRLEFVAEPIRISEVQPGMVKTPEFTMIRQGGSQAGYDKTYAGVAEPLVAEDVAEVVRWIATLPSHFNVDTIVVRPQAQASAYKVHRVE